jgi:predicted transcriptional regulator
MRIVVPAMRVAVAKKLSEHGMSQVEIAKRLGVAQAAISKYLNNDYSKKIAAMERLIEKRKLERRIVDLALSGNKKALENAVGSLALNSRIVCSALKL